MKNKKNIDIYDYDKEDEAEDKNEDLDFEWLAINAECITYYSDLDMNNKFKNSFFGKFFKPSFFESEQSKNYFEEKSSSYSFIRNIIFKYDDVIVSDDNDIYNFIIKFKDLKSVNNLNFSLEINFKDTDMIKFESFNVSANIISFGNKYNVKFFDMISYEKFVLDMKELMKDYNYNFPSILSMTNYYIYKNHPLVKKYNINLFNHIENMDSIKKLLTNLQNIKSIENY